MLSNAARDRIDSTKKSCYLMNCVGRPTSIWLAKNSRPRDWNSMMRNVHPSLFMMAFHPKHSPVDDRQFDARHPTVLFHSTWPYKTSTISNFPLPALHDQTQKSYSTSSRLRRIRFSPAIAIPFYMHANLIYLYICIYTFRKRPKKIATKIKRLYLSRSWPAKQK